VIIYDKGTWIMHMLRRRMGDESFLRMLGELRKRYAYRTISTEQFRELAAEFVPAGAPDRSLQNFFDTWVYSTGVPTLEFSQKVRGKAPALELVVVLKQSGVPEEFSLDLPVAITLPGQAKPRIEWLQTGSEPARLTLPLKVAPTKVEFAPGLGVLAAQK
jgi:aminopeptidase N